MINVCVEVEAGSCDKHLYDEKTLVYRGTRRVSQPYPYPYGFILGTVAADGDRVDCYLITREKLRAGAIVGCKPIGLLEQVEDDEVDHKVLAARRGQHVEVDQELWQELRDFIHAVFAQFPDVSVRVGHILSRQAAWHYIQACREP